jgi:glycyl-tRNA synthetase alpha subunit
MSHESTHGIERIKMLLEHDEENEKAEKNKTSKKSYKDVYILDTYQFSSSPMTSKPAKTQN